MEVVSFIMLNFCKEYPNINLTMQHTGGIFHDRFIVLDYETKDGSYVSDLQGDRENRADPESFK